MKKSKLKSILLIVALSIFTVVTARQALNIRSSLKSIGEYQRMSEVTENITPSDLKAMEQEARELRSREIPCG